MEPLDGETIRTLIYRILTTEQQKRLELDRQLDLSYGVPGLARFRINVFLQRESFAAVLRVIPDKLKTLEELGLPDGLRELTTLPRGLVLVTGPTGSGKSTTLAAMIDEINRTRSTTSSRSRTRSSSCTGTSGASSTSARSAPTPRASRTRCARRCARTPT